MIESFADKDTASIWNKKYVRNFPEPLQRKALRKLRFIDAAESIEELFIPRSNRLEKMKGKWKKYHSIHVNDQYRIWFVWKSGHAYEVKFGDYHDKL